jgi:hypothetical protein
VASGLFFFSSSILAHLHGLAFTAQFLGGSGIKRTKESKYFCKRSASVGICLVFISLGKLLHQVVYLLQGFQAA